MSSTRTSRFVTRLSFAGLVGIGLAAGIAGTADAAPDIKVGPTVPTTAKPGPQQPIDPDRPLTNPTDPCKVTHGAPKDCPKPDSDFPLKENPKDACKVTHGAPKDCPKSDPKSDPKPDPCAGDACDRPVPGKPTFAG